MRKRALILGLGISGKAAAKLLLSQGYDVCAIDDRVDECNLPISIVHPKKIDLHEIDLFVPSPGVPREHPFYVQAREYGIPIKGEAQLALENTENRIIGITGTNGKSTNTALIAHVLNVCGQKARAVGNIGVPITEVVLECEPDEILVVELSSFQIETLSGKLLDYAAVLNISPDHLDRYDSYDSYAMTKLHLQKCVKNGGECFISKEVERQFPDYAEAMTVLPQDNIAKTLLAKFGVCEKAFASARHSFSPLPHRLQELKAINGVRIINDSKATNIEATIHAVEKIGDQIILIAGGKAKESSFQRWISVFTNRVKRVLTIGASGASIAQELDGHIDVEVCSTLEEAIKKGLQLAKSGDVLLLSPGCSSFDQFKNFEQRGERFIQGIYNESKRYHSCSSSH